MTQNKRFISANRNHESIRGLAYASTKANTPERAAITVLIAEALLSGAGAGATATTTGSGDGDSATGSGTTASGLGATTGTTVTGGRATGDGDGDGGGRVTGTGLTGTGLTVTGTGTGSPPVVGDFPSSFGRETKIVLSHVESYGGILTTVPGCTRAPPANSGFTAAISLYVVLKA